MGLEDPICGAAGEKGSIGSDEIWCTGCGCPGLLPLLSHHQHPATGDRLSDLPNLLHEIIPFQRLLLHTRECDSSLSLESGSCFLSFLEVLLGGCLHDDMSR